MEFLVIWSIMAGVVAMVAVSKGRTGWKWFLYGFAIWPIALVHILVTHRSTVVVEARAIQAGQAVKCPHCAELIKPEALVCRFCSRDVSPRRA